MRIMLSPAAVSHSQGPQQPETPRVQAKTPLSYGEIVMHGGMVAALPVVALNKAFACWGGRLVDTARSAIEWRKNDQITKIRQSGDGEITNAMFGNAVVGALAEGAGFLTDFAHRLSALAAYCVTASIAVGAGLVISPVTYTASKFGPLRSVLEKAGNFSSSLFNDSYDSGFYRQGVIN